MGHKSKQSRGHTRSSNSVRWEVVEFESEQTMNMWPVQFIAQLLTGCSSGTTPPRLYLHYYMMVGKGGQETHCAGFCSKCSLSLTYGLCLADTFIQKTKKLYMDTRTQRNLAKLTEELGEVHSIMTKNIQEVLGQGEKLDSECWGGLQDGGGIGRTGGGCWVVPQLGVGGRRPHDS